MIVFVLVYDHDHGTDVSVYATEELAQLARADIVAAWCGDLADKGVTKKSEQLSREGIGPVPMGCMRMRAGEMSG